MQPALGAVNEVKSLIEGVGPSLFGILLSASENDRYPGWPYFLAAIMVALAYQAGRKLPEDSENYTSELYFRGMRKGAPANEVEMTFGLLDSVDDQENNEGQSTLI